MPEPIHSFQILFYGAEITCDRCRGKGSVVVPFEGSEGCGQCRGTGKVRPAYYRPVSHLVEAIAEAVVAKLDEREARDA